MNYGRRMTATAAQGSSEHFAGEKCSVLRAVCAGGGRGVHLLLLHAPLDCGFFLLLLLFYNFIYFCLKFVPRGKGGKVGGTTLGDHCLDLACQYFGLDVSKLAFQFSNLDLVLFQKFNCAFLFGTWSIFPHKREAISIQAGRRFSDLHETKIELVFTKDGNPLTEILKGTVTGLVTQAVNLL